jgi:carbamate kinase
MRVVVALGGNAILKRGDRGTVAEQRAAIREASEGLSRICIEGHELVVTHGNGPQVGRLMLQDEAMPDRVPRFTLDVHVAETQGQLGYLIQSFHDIAALIGLQRIALRSMMIDGRIARDIGNILLSFERRFLIPAGAKRINGFIMG